MLNLLNLNDPQIWVAVSFILFFLFFGNFIWKKFSAFLDNKINAIGEEINLANELHQEAKDLLSEEIKKFQGLDNEINNMISEGKIKAQNLYNESKDRINNEIEKLEKSSLEKVKYLEHQAIDEIQEKISKEAMSITKKFLIKSLNKENQVELLNNSIQEVENTLSTKDKFIQ